MIELELPGALAALSHWDDIMPFVQRAIDESNGEMDIEDINNRIAQAEVQLVFVKKDGKLIAVITFEMQDFPSGKKVMHINTAGGDLVDEWFELIDAKATELANHYGCKDVYIVGRKGWERKMKHLGYSHAHTIITKEVC